MGKINEQLRKALDEFMKTYANAVKGLFEPLKSITKIFLKCSIIWMPI